MAKLLVGPMNRGLRNDVTAFNVDNEAFPTLQNFYQWRGRVKRKRGTEPLSRLARYFDSTNTGAIYTAGSNTQVLSSGQGNLISGFTSSGIQTNASIVPGSVTINDVTSSTVYSDNGLGVLTGGSGGTINYATGSFTITGGASHTINAKFIYYPSLPVLGLEQLSLDPTANPGLIDFDQTYSYQTNVTSPYSTYSVSFYNNPATSAYTSYTAKTQWTAANWNLQDYQQVWTANYQGALWTTPGIPSPFVSTNIGMQFAPASSIAFVSQTSTTLVVTISGSPLVVGDFVFLNEWTSGTAANADTLNFQTGYVTNIAGSNITIKFPNAAIASDTYTPGIIQYLTNVSSSTKDCIRWYNGSPVTAQGVAPSINGVGWVNFCPPLSSKTYGISTITPAQYYLVGARMIVPFKDRLLFFGPVVQTSTGAPTYLPDTVIFSQVGTPYYTASFNSPINALTSYQPILVPSGQTAQPSAFWEDQPGPGGYLTAGFGRSITSVSANEDVLIVGFSDRQARLVYTSNDALPFLFYVINSELGSDSTFSSVILDRGVLTIGGRGIILTDQTSSQRIDLEIPDEVFEIKLTEQGNRRITAQRDYINEWIYFTYPSSLKTRYPSKTLQYNYRDSSWGMFDETYTTYGIFRPQTGETWGTLSVQTWGDWSAPWGSGESRLLQPLVIAGNQQGFILIRNSTTTGEAPSLYIKGFSGSTITSPDHALQNGDYITISGTMWSTNNPGIDGKIYQVGSVTANDFTIDPPFPSGSFTYIGGGVIQRYYIPFLQSRQFPMAWELGRKTRLGVQQYLFTTTDIGEVTLLIFLSQNANSPYNLPPIVPEERSTNNSLIYNTTVYTCPESTNLGLTEFNSNLQMPGAISQQQIWHRMNTSLIGDTVQIGITLSDKQMRRLSNVGTYFAITGASQASYCVLTTTAQFPSGTLVKIQNIAGMTELNFTESQWNYYYVVSSTSTTMTIAVNSTSFIPYSSGGTVIEVAPIVQTQEIELHSFIIDVTPSQLLA